MADSEELGFDTSWGSANVNYAIAVSIGAGGATGVGGALVFFPAFFKSIPQATVLAVSLALSAGVMLYVSFIEIFAKSLGSIQEVDGMSEGGATAITTVCFFTGMLICVLLEMLVHSISRRYGVEHEHICPSAADGLIAAPAAAADGGDTKQSSAPSPKQVDQAAQVPSPPASPPAEGGGSGGGASTADAASAARTETHAVAVEIVGSDTSIDLAEKRRLATMGVMTALAIAIHNFPEGLATFLATVADTEVGLSLGVAIAVHNIPEGICVAMPIYYATGNKRKAFLWSLLSGVTEPIGGILGFAALQPVFTPLVFGIIFSMVGGMMVFIVCHELLPAAHRYMNNTVKTTAWLVAGMVIMATSLVVFTL